MEFVAVEHPRFRKVDRDIFTKRVAPDCMNFECRLNREAGRVKLEACCQYGVDTDLGERDGILAHRDQIAALLRSEVDGVPWFSEIEHIDPDFPSGKLVRTTKHGEGCIFLAHDLRGCAIHRASIEGNWDFHGIKPHLCRLFPLTYAQESILFSDDYEDYSCAGVDIFGADLIEALDAVEAQLLGSHEIDVAC